MSMYIFKGERNVVMYFLIGCFNVMYCRFSNVYKYELTACKFMQECPI